MTFRPRDWRRTSAKPQSPAQEAATQRNFGIFKLRGLWVSMALLREPYRSIARAAIDMDLVARGALMQEDHEVESRRRYERKHPEFYENDTIPF